MGMERWAAVVTTARHASCASPSRRANCSSASSVGSAGLAHTALEVEGGLDGLRSLHDRLTSRGVPVEFTADHVLTKSVYFFDPDGNRLEIFSQEMTPAAGKQYLHDARSPEDVMRPLSLERSPLEATRERHTDHPDA